MKRVVLIVFSAVFFLHASPSSALQDFTLLDQNGTSHNLHYYSDMNAVVLISQGNGCPIIRQEIPYLRKLERMYGPKKVVFLMINANPQDDRASIVNEVKEYRITSPVLEDKAQIVTESLGLSRTAGAVVIDPADWKIVYHGAITDRLDYGTSKSKATHEYLRDAIDSLLEDRPVAVAETPIKGCLIHLESADRRTPYTYTEDVAPILEKKCLLCHVPGGVAPWTMSDYGKVRGWGPMIREVVQTKRMSPWSADPHYGRFQGDISLSPEETRSIVGWIDQGFVRGEGEDLLAKPRPEKSKWVLGKPDLVFSLKEEQSIPASGGPLFKTIEADRVVQEDIWVQASDVQPSNLKVTHHVMAIIDPRDMPHLSESGVTTEKGLGGYVPGNDPLVWPEGAGLFIPKGTRLTFLTHYVPTGKLEKDLTQLGLYLCKKEPSSAGFFAGLEDKTFTIPAGVKDHKITGTFSLKDAATLVAIKPHMHNRGKSMRTTAIYPDGTSEILLLVPDYKFAYQRLYTLEEPKELPAGTQILVEGHYDNSAQNPRNPDATKDVISGMRGEDTEMFWCRIAYTVKKEKK